jgi:hypothetical protein
LWSSDANTNTDTDNDGDAYGNTDRDANGNAERNPGIDTTTAPDTVSAANTIAKRRTPFCGDSRNTLASSARVTREEAVQAAVPAAII